MVRTFLFGLLVCAAITGIGAQEPDTSSAPLVSPQDTSTLPDIAPSDSVVTVVPPSTSSAILEEEDLFIIEDGEESIVGFEAVVVPDDTVAIAQESQPVNTAPSTASGPDTIDVGEDVGETVIGQSVPPPSKMPAASGLDLSVTEEVLTGPAVVEEVKSINFARNLKEYRSPKLAMLLSLVLPGAGQAYARNYTKTAIFAAAELGVVGAAIGFNIKGRNAIAQARQQANKSFDTTQFAQYYASLQQFFYSEVYQQAPDADSLAKARMNSIFYQFDENRSFVQDFNKSARKRSDGYYSQIQGKEFVQGWLDVVPEFSDLETRETGEVFEATAGGEKRYFKVYGDDNDRDSAYLVQHSLTASGFKDDNELLYGYSHSQEKFRDMVSAANQHYRRGTNVLFLLLVNHFVSALDAGITAKRYNETLLGKQSWWQRIEVEQQFVWSGTDVAPGCVVKVAF